MIIAWHIFSPVISQVHAETCALALKLTNHMLCPPPPSRTPRVHHDAVDGGWPSSFLWSKGKISPTQQNWRGGGGGVQINSSINSRSARAAVIMSQGEEEKSWSQRDRVMGGRRSVATGAESCCCSLLCCFCGPLLFRFFTSRSLFLLSHSALQSGYSAFHMPSSTLSLMSSLWPMPLFYH